MVFPGQNNLTPADEDLEFLFSWAEEIAEYRLHAYFERNAKSLV